MISYLSAIAVAVTCLLTEVAAGSYASTVGPAPSPNTFREHCATCHGADLGGSSGPATGPALMGEPFHSKWSKVPAQLFVSFVQDRMPLNEPGSLNQSDSTAAANYVLFRNHLPLTSMIATVSEPTAAPLLEARDEMRDTAYRSASQARSMLLAGLGPVDDANLASPPASDWLSWRGTSATDGYSKLDQINRSNVGSLALAWSLSLASGTNAIAPLVHDGVMYIHSSGTVEALDARDGDLLWQFTRPETALRSPSSQPRGMALYGHALYVSTVDDRVLALDAKTGKLLWDRGIGSAADVIQLTAAPLAARGKIIQGASGCSGREAGGGCFIVALDAASGKEIWRFHTIARPGEPGGDSWNGTPWNQRHGASVWDTGSYDPKLNLVYFGTGQTYAISTLLDPQAQKGRSADALYTDTTLALDPDTGKLVWYYQHSAGDVWDHDWAFERTIASVDGPGGPRKLVITGGKLGIFDALDARTGAYLWSFDFGLQNIVTAIDPKTGRKTFDKALAPEFGKFKFICPSTAGNRNWPTTAYDPTTRLLYVPLTPTCMLFARSSTGKAVSLEDYGQMMMQLHRSPKSGGNYGWLAALDVAHRRIAWIDKGRAPLASAALATSGGLVFEGARDRTFRAVDGSNGNTLWQTRLPSLPNAFPLTYAVGGRQYVAIVTGGGTVLDTYQATLTPEIPPGSDNKTIMVFALPSATQSRN